MRRFGLVPTVVLVGVAACRSPTPPEPAPPAAASAKEVGVGDRVPSFRAPDIEGRATSIEAGKVHVIAFLATWSAPDQKSVPRLEAIYQRHRAEGLNVLAIDIDDTIEQVPRFYRENGGTFPVVHDTEHRISRRFQVPCSPTYYVVDRDGVVRFRHCGYHDGSPDEIEREAVKLLSPSGS